MNSTKCICTIKYKTHYYLMQIMNIYLLFYIVSY